MIMNSELKILKKIWENNEEASLNLIANQTGFGIDYARYICNCLSAKEQVKLVKGKRGWYKVTPQGRRELERCGVAKPKSFRRQSRVEKVTYYFPKKFSPKPPEGGSQKVKVKEAKKSEEIKKVDLQAEEKKFNLGRSIVKAVSYLRDL